MSVQEPAIAGWRPWCFALLGLERLRLIAGCN